ncbi:MAG: DUF1957 domain-containing protein [Spirochaetaceae bacterium]|jgi:1,4-alpha-glucan branching enzyme|nr:DUF1957 domain-containing protein [Spirochaetaceae bacterium]
MEGNNTISILLNCHLPFIRHTDSQIYADEMPFFQALSETYIPFLQMLERLDIDCVPCRIGIVLSPLLAAMFRNTALVDKYLRYVDKQIAFGEVELIRTENKHNDSLWKLARYYYNTIKEKKLAFIERYNKDIISALRYYRQKGRLEILSTAGTHCFLPYYTQYSQIIHTQFETALTDYRNLFGDNPAGFWLPELGWSKEIDVFLRRYGINYTVITAHAAALADPPGKTGSFYPYRSSEGCFLLVRDHYAFAEIYGGEDSVTYTPYRAESPILRIHDGIYCDYYEDIGFKLPQSAVRNFLDKDGKRLSTGYRYLSAGDKYHVYDRSGAKKRAKKYAGEFLERRMAALSQAYSLTGMAPVSLCVWDADSLGRFWQEGFFFLEELFRLGAAWENLVFATPFEYLCRQDSRNFQTLSPEFSSGAYNGYGEDFLDRPNDWIYRHIYHAIERMTELSERFSDESGLRATALNQSVREILLAQTSDFVKIRHGTEGGAWNEGRILAHLRNFTAIYESLGGDYLSTKLLAELSAAHSIFPDLNYHVFRKRHSIF